MTVACPSCGAIAADDARFCAQCGHVLAPIEMAAPREERKVVSILFADLVGFTSRAEHMDPEEVRALLQPYHTAVRTELEHWGGTVEKGGANSPGEGDGLLAIGKRRGLPIRGRGAREGVGWGDKEDTARGSPRREALAFDPLHHRRDPLPHPDAHGGETVA